MRYEGPIYRPPSEAGSLLIQATVGCPHNRCTFCMVYKKGPRYRVRPVNDIIEDLETAKAACTDTVRTIFFPAGNTIAAPTDTLVAVFSAARRIFPEVKRLTVYGSAFYILEKGEQDLRRLADAGLTRIHVGLESGHDKVLSDIKKGAGRDGQLRAGMLLNKAGIENNTYVMLGIGGKDMGRDHALQTATALNYIAPHTIRLRTFVPKVGTPLLHKVQKGRFVMAGPHDVLREAKILLENLSIPAHFKSDHYTNYVNLDGDLPADKDRLLRTIEEAMASDESRFRPFFIGTQ